MHSSPEILAFAMSLPTRWLLIRCHLCLVIPALARRLRVPPRPIGKRRLDRAVLPSHTHNSGPKDIKPCAHNNTQRRKTPDQPPTPKAKPKQRCGTNKAMKGDVEDLCSFVLNRHAAIAQQLFECATCEFVGEHLSSL